MKTPVLETERLILRPVTLEDAPAAQKYFNNWNVVQYLNPSIPWPYPEDGSEQWLKNVALPKIKEGKAHYWAIIIRNNDPEEASGIIEFRIKGLS